MGDIWEKPPDGGKHPDDRKDHTRLTQSKTRWARGNFDWFTGTVRLKERTVKEGGNKGTGKRKKQQASPKRFVKKEPR